MADTTNTDGEIFESVLETEKPTDSHSILNKKVTHLSNTFQTEQKTLFKTFAEIILDQPGCAHDFVHKIQLKPYAKPVRQKT